MGSSPHAWWDWGYGGIFACVFLEQIGVPIPAFPALLAAGALVAGGELHLGGCLLTALAASLLADLIWYQIGRVQGGAVLNLMCRLSWRPDTCVSNTKNAFAKYGTSTLLFSKFVPGLSVLAPPLSGMARVALGRFILFDGIGAVIWAIVPLLAGAYLQKTFVAVEAQVSAWKGALPWVCGLAILGVMLWRYWDRRRFTQRLARGLEHGIDPTELKDRLDRGEELIVIDVRDEMNLRAKAVLVPGARWMPYSTLPDRLAELALEKPIVTYCDCPEDQAAVGMADLLRARGAQQVHPLRGGLEGWRNQGWPTEAWSPEDGGAALVPI
jgi:membrane protein DedA with SNARE-associated domain/rhodanese-related sulfurtransferase